MLTSLPRLHNPWPTGRDVESVTTPHGQPVRAAGPARTLPRVDAPGEEAAAAPDRGLRLAAVLVAAEALALLALAGAELAALSSDRIGLGVVTAVFFAVCGLVLGWAAWALWRGIGTARGPVVVAQLIQLGLAWSTRSEAPAVAVLLAGCALAVLALVLRPSATQTLGE